MVLAPTEEQVRWARAVLAAGAEGSGVAHGGQMIDRPVSRPAQAQALLDRAAAPLPEPTNSLTRHLEEPSGGTGGTDWPSSHVILGDSVRT
ncbi:hypothetical protein AQJ54_20515 [Streptomyces griseorubiginosus]|uniref:HpcH/HpaI aldolase/citrate lyase domain-containing protein n=1 Tax=Streptomyces griseorubiginosus TaxID=67304 RepID=A0A101S0U8_9ACTN|nr:hypothetical protein AQJ54_20515 [Streptomyces griseorubiginosus]